MQRAAILIGIAAFFVSLQPARAAEEPARPSDAKSGALMLKTGDDAYTPAPRLGIDVDLTVSGPTIRARVTSSHSRSTGVGPHHADTG
jgi:Ca-activated chloride channel family protein